MEMHEDAKPVRTMRCIRYQDGYVVWVSLTGQDLHRSSLSEDLCISLFLGVGFYLAVVHIKVTMHEGTRST
jgi:hypothetical protein